MYLVCFLFFYRRCFSHPLTNCCSYWKRDGGWVNNFLHRFLYQTCQAEGLPNPLYLAHLAESRLHWSGNILHLMLAFKNHFPPTGKNSAWLGILKQIIKLSLNTALISECFLAALSGVNYLPTLAITETLWAPCAWKGLYTILSQKCHILKCLSNVDPAISEMAHTWFLSSICCLTKPLHRARWIQSE